MKDITRDPLTGAKNWEAITVFLDQQIENARLNGKGFSLLNADINHFKHFNLHNGIVQGDDLLVRFVILAQPLNCGDPQCMGPAKMTVSGEGRQGDGGKLCLYLGMR